MSEFSAISDQSLPPQNVEAEESILGGILLDPDAIARVAEILPAEAFYLQAHQTVYQSAIALHNQGKPTDLMTISTWLADQQLLDKVGGKAKLAQLADRTVSAVNIDGYAQLVLDKYLRRKLIHAGHQIVQLGYDTTEALNVILDRAEQNIFNLTQDRPQSGLVPLYETLLATYDEVEGRYNQDKLPGLNSGFYDLDTMTSGLQPSDLLILAGRPSMGKTALGLNIARNIAGQYKSPVALFSLEMSKEQLTQRLLASEAKIESNRLRSGRLTQQDFSEINKAIGTLSDLPIFIDDTATLTVMEMRSQTRRLQAEQGQIGLVLLDYLQLMEGGGDNRVQELSRITRSLKTLAREIKAPVIALSQLSRGVEQRTNKRPMLSDLRESGCLAGDSLVTIADTGEEVPIKDLVGHSGFNVFALNLETWKLEKAPVSKVFSTGVKATLALTTALERKIIATGNHQFLTFNGWVRLDELKEGDYIALPGKIPQEAKTQQIKSSEATLFGHLIGDGCTLRCLGKVIPFLKSKVTVDPPLAPTPLTSPLIGGTEGGSPNPPSQGGNPWGDAYGTAFSLRHVAPVYRNGIINSPEILRVGTSDVYWDKITSITPTCESRPVYDLTVPKLHNFVANHIIVHNSI